MDVDDFLGMLDSPVKKGNLLLSSSRDRSDSDVLPRRFKLQEVVDMLGLSGHQRLYRAMDSGSIPEPRVLGNNAKYYLLEDIEKIREYFDAYPGRKPGQKAVVIAVSTFKGGATKTTTTFQFAGYLSMLGYRVLLGDVDPQATLSMLMDMEPNIRTLEEHTASAFLVADDEVTKQELVGTAIHPTRLPNVDIIPSCMKMQTVEMLMSQRMTFAVNRQDRAAMLSTFYRLSHILDAVKEDYDVILLDGTPSLGILPLNMICAADSLIVPVPSSINDFASTNSFLQMLAEYIESVAELGVGDLPLPNMRFVSARFRTDKSPSRSTDIWTEFTKQTFGDLLFKNAIHKHDSVVDNCLTLHRTAFEVNHSDLGIAPRTIRAARDDYANLFDEIIEECILPHWGVTTEGRVVEQANG